MRAYDPVGMPQARPLLPDVTYCDNAYACAEGADALVIVTEWEQFRALDLARLKASMARPVVVDLRNIYRPDDMLRHGLAYTGVGRSASAHGSRRWDLCRSAKRRVARGCMLLCRSRPQPEAA